MLQLFCDKDNLVSFHEARLSTTQGHMHKILHKICEQVLHCTPNKIAYLEFLLHLRHIKSLLMSTSRNRVDSINTVWQRNQTDLRGGQSTYKSKDWVQHSSPEFISFTYAFMNLSYIDCLFRVALCQVFRIQSQGEELNLWLHRPCF